MSPSGTERQAVLDEEHLRLLALGYVISGVVTALLSLLGIIYALLGAFLIAIPSPSRSGEPPPAFVGVIFVVVGGLFVLGGAGLAAAKLYASRCLRRRERRTFCLVTAAITCLGIPYGTALGLATFVVLQRPTVSLLFAPPVDGSPPLPAPPPPAPPAS